jgi:hypothetical protein
MEPPGTYSKKLEGTLEMQRIEHALDLHAQIGRGLLKPKVLDNVGMVQNLERLALKLQRLHDGDLPRVVLVTSGPRDLDLLDSDHLTRRRIESQIDTAIGPPADELASNPLERR